MATLLDYFDSFQRQDDRNLEVSAKKILDECEIEEESLLQILYCVFSTPLSSESRDAIEATIDLLAAVAYDNQILIDQVIQGTSVSQESIRALSCRFLGQVIPRYSSCLTVSNTSTTKVLDQISQSILPRFTDKLQSVRKEAITAAANFLNDSTDDPEVRQALVWAIQHDPSVTNRQVALQALPVTPQTIDVFLARIRDIHLKLRITALERLQEYQEDWQPEDLVALLNAGYTPRCEQTKQATAKLVSLLLKTFQYQPLELLKHLGVQDFEDAAEIVVEILTKTPIHDLLANELSEPELRAFAKGIEDAALQLHELDQEISPERAFWSRCAAGTKQQSLTDAQLFCEVVERHTLLLIQAIEKDDSEAIDSLSFVCIQLMQLSTVADLEEGSRRHMGALVKRMLSSILLPDDLVESCIQALKSCTRDFAESVREILEELEKAKQHELADAFLLRAISIITVSMEMSDVNFSKSDLSAFSTKAIEALENDNDLLKEAGVACLGKIGIFAGPSADQVDTLVDLVKDASSDEIRGQSLLALGDWGSMHPHVLPTDFTFTLVSLMDESSSIGIKCIASEVASKLLISGRVNSTALIARLVVNFFENEGLDEDEEEVVDVKEVGNPIRLQQLLSVFFPAYCARSPVFRKNFLSSACEMLSVVQNKHKQKKRPRGSKTWPHAKMVEYMATTADLNLKIDENTEISSGALLTTVQVAKFIEQNADDLNKTTLRALCKYMAGAPIELEREEEVDLRNLLESIDEIEALISDATAAKSLESVNELLAQVDFSDEQNDEENEVVKENAELDVSKGGEAPTETPRQSLSTVN